MPTAATAITAVASQPSAFSRGRRANWPITFLREAISMIITMIGTAATPLITALQNSALIGSMRGEVEDRADQGADAIAP